MTYEHLSALDASIIIREVATELGINFKDLIPKYFIEAQKLDRLKEVVPQSLLSVLENIQKEESTKNLENKTSENP
jgi:hypothetical protein